MQTTASAPDVTKARRVEDSKSGRTASQPVEVWNPIGAVGFLATIAFAVAALVTPIALLLTGVWISIGGGGR